MDYKKQKSGPKSRYTDSFRRMVVEEVLAGAFIAGVARKHGITHRSTVSSWVKWYQKNYDIVRQPIAMKEDEPELAAAKKWAEELEKALSMAELKIASLETLIDVAEEQLKVDIRKKRGAKQ